MEPRLPLGSFPSATGTVAGELLPVEAVVDLTPPQLDQLQASDLRLLEMQSGEQSEVDAAFREMHRINQAIIQQQDETAERAVDDLLAQESVVRAPQAETERDAPRELPAMPDARPALLTDDMLNSSINQTDSEPSEASSLATDLDEAASETGDSFDSQNSDNDSLPLAEVTAATSFETDGSGAEVTQASNITFAATGGPMEAPRLTPGAGPAFQVQQSSFNATASGAFSGALPGAAYQPGADGVAGNASDVVPTAWFNNQSAQQTVVRYDFRDVQGVDNQLSQAEQTSAEAALQAWTQATQGRIQFVRDTQATADAILNIGKGDLTPLGFESDVAGTLAVGGGFAMTEGNSQGQVVGTVWLDSADHWDSVIGGQSEEGGFDVFTVVAHEVGHVLGAEDHYDPSQSDIMYGVYDQERSVEAIGAAIQRASFEAVSYDQAESLGGYELHQMIAGSPQLTANEVSTLLNFATTVTPSRDAIIAIVDRGGRILGVRIEDGVNAGLIANPELRTFAIDGAVAKARTAAFFANNGRDSDSTNPRSNAGTPLTSRTIRKISQTTISYREVHSNPNSSDPLVRGPGFVAPIGVGGHFPPAIANTPPVDLFAIEHTNRDGLTHPGADSDLRTAGDNIALPSRFNVPVANLLADTDGDRVLELLADTDADGVPDAGPVSLTGSVTNSPVSYGVQSGIFPQAQSRGIATLPGGVPLFADTDGNGVGDYLIGGVGVFFPGPDGMADFEQGFAAGQTEAQRTNASRVLEAELIAVATAGGSLQASRMGVPGAKPPGLPIPRLDIPFGRIDLVGIQLEVIGPTPGIQGVRQLINFGRTLTPALGSSAANSRIAGLGDERVATATSFGTLAPTVNGVALAGAAKASTIDGLGVFSGWLVAPRAGGGLTQLDVINIVRQGETEANRVRAAIRLPLGTRTQMVFAVSDTDGNVLGVYRMPDATFFSIDVAVAKSRNTAYYADTTAIKPVDQVRLNSSLLPTATNLVSDPAGVAFTNRTFRFLAEPRFPSGVQVSQPGQFSQLYDLGRAVGIDPVNESAKKLLVDSTAPINIAEFNKQGLPQVPVPGNARSNSVLANPNSSVAGHDAFFPATNFRDTANIANQNGIVFFPGATPLYKNGILVGGFGVSGDGVDQDDVVTFAGAQGFLPTGNTKTADQFYVDRVRLPFIKFNRNPRG